MKTIFSIVAVLLFLGALVHTNLFASPLTATVTMAQGRNSIAGNVYTDTGDPLGDLQVELLDNYGRNLSRTKTNSAGGFIFFGLIDGRYQIRVRALATEYADEVKEVSLISVSAGGEIQQLDFRLRVRDSVNRGLFAPPGTIFAQDIPDAARKLFETGVTQLREKKEIEGFTSLKEALEIFPNYYLALNRLGTEYASRGHLDRNFFVAAQVLLTKALEVNSKSFSSAFALGFTQYHLGVQIDEAIENLRRAVQIDKSSVNGNLWLGLALKRAGKLEQAESSLKQAAELSKGKDPDIHWHLAGLYREQKRNGDAAMQLELFLKYKPEARDANKIRELISQLRSKPAP